MHPAYSVIIFTSSSGAGYGLLIWLALARLTGAWDMGPVVAVGACLVALGLRAATGRRGLAAMMKNTEAQGSSNKPRTGSVI